MKASFTYEVITPESAEYGEAAEHGWILPGHWEFPLQDNEGHHPKTLEDAQAGEYDVKDLSTLVSFAQELGICSSEEGRSVDPDHGDYSTDEQRFYALHLDGVTESSKRRIWRLIDWGCDMSAHTEQYKGFQIDLYLLEEDTPLLDIFDPTVTDIDTLRENVESDFWLYFCAKVTASLNGRTLAEDYLGCCIYESAEDFVKNSGYYEDMRDIVAEDARQWLDAAAEHVTCKA